MRVFFAVDLPEGIRVALGEIQRDLKGVTKSARWTDPKSIHVTLKFIGEIAGERLAAIDSATAGLIIEPFSVSVRGIGLFPGNRSPRVFWAGLESAAMRELANEIDARMEVIGLQREKREFRPHLTLARARGNRFDDSLVEASRKYANHDFGSFIVDRFYLIESFLEPTGAVYDKLRQYLLEPRSPS